jgi:hypothetical protein
VYRERCRPRELILTNTRLVLANGEQVQVSHFPYAETHPEQKRTGELDAPTDKFTSWRPTDDGSWLLCGHVHEKRRQRGRMINVGVDAWGGTPFPSPPSPRCGGRTARPSASAVVNDGRVGDVQAGRAAWNMAWVFCHYRTGYGTVLP